MQRKQTAPSKRMSLKDPRGSPGGGCKAEAEAQRPELRGDEDDHRVGVQGQREQLRRDVRRQRLRRWGAADVRQQKVEGVEQPVAAHQEHGPGHPSLEIHVADAFFPSEMHPNAFIQQLPQFCSELHMRYTIWDISLNGSF